MSHVVCARGLYKYVKERDIVTVNSNCFFFLDLFILHARAVESMVTVLFDNKFTKVKRRTILI